MRRRLRLNVLYWPTFAGAAVAGMLLCTGPLEPYLGSFLGPRVSHLSGRLRLAGEDAGRSGRRDAAGRVGRSQVAGLPSAANRTLLATRGGQMPLGLENGNASVRDEDATSRKATAHRGLSGRADMIAASSPAAVRLGAPRFPVDEELAGLDLEEAAPTLRLVSSAKAKSAAATGERDDVASPGLRSGARAFVGDALSSGSYVGDEVRASGPAEAFPFSRHGVGGGWPETPQLLVELQTAGEIWSQRSEQTRFVAFPMTAGDLDFTQWQRDVSDELDRLRRLSSLASAESAAILERLSQLADQGNEAGELIDDRERQIICLRASHALQRRVALWTAVHRATRPTSAWVGDEVPMQAETAVVESLIARLAAETAETRDAAAWQDYLLLDDLAGANRSGDEPRRRLASQRFLSRLKWHGLSDAQRRWLDRDSVTSLAAAVRRWAVAPVDYASLLGQLERQESDAIDLGGIDVARAAQSLRFAASREAGELAEVIDTHYRNANVRLAVTDAMINRFVPAIDARVEPIRRRMFGADVRGTSHVESRVTVRLIPSGDTWKMNLETHGDIHAMTASRSGSVAVHTGTKAGFVSRTPIEIGRYSADAGHTHVDVEAATRLRGISSNFDSIPLLGSLVREIALNRYHALQPQARQIQQGQVRHEVENEIDRRVAEQIDTASDAFVRHLVGPLGSLGLSPQVVDMRTDDRRLSVRYRVGGDWQLAAFTPRPRAPGDSLMSLQVHQSLLNNTIETVLPAGKTKTLAEISSHIKELFAIQGDSPIADDDDHDDAENTILHFAATRPVTVEIEDDRLWITLRVMRLSREGAVDLRRFIVRACYRAEVDGLEAHLVRDGHLRISGPGMSMRDRLPVRAIFNKVFSTNRALPLTPKRLTEHPAIQDLVITQLEMRDGWLGFALGPAGSPPKPSLVAGSESLRHERPRR